MYNLHLTSNRSYHRGSSYAPRSTLQDLQYKNACIIHSGRETKICLDTLVGPPQEASATFRSSPSANHLLPSDPLLCTLSSQQTTHFMPPLRLRLLLLAVPKKKLRSFSDALKINFVCWSESNLRT